MNERLHKVVVYVHHELKRFTITARMDRARLPGVDEQMVQQGYTRLVLAEALDKLQATKLRDGVREAYAGTNYAYETREQLS